jgi:hypothetical protein
MTAMGTWRFIHLSSQFSPAIKISPKIARDELKSAHLPLPKKRKQDHEDHDDERYNAPRLVGDVAFRNRLSDDWTVGCGKPQTRG